MSHPVQYRPAKPSDIPFVMDSWLNSWRVSPWAGCIPNNYYYKVTRAAIEQLIIRGAKLEIACKESDPDKILGWVCSELTGPDTVIHYLYVKEGYLPFDIGAKLVERTEGKKPGFYTYRYRQVQDACPGDQGWRHEPSIARRK